jgi:hypothetical protein
MTMKNVPVLFLGGDDGDDVRMVERREQPRLAQQLAEVEILAMRDFDRDALVDPGVFGEVDGAEAAAAERFEDAVLAERLAAKNHLSRKYTIARVHRFHAPGASSASDVVALPRLKHITSRACSGSSRRDGARVRRPRRRVGCACRDGVTRRRRRRTDRQGGSRA